MIHVSNAILIIVKPVRQKSVQIVAMDTDLFIMMKAMNTHVNFVKEAAYSVMANRRCVPYVKSSIIYRIQFA